jgi:hypothetical protein
MMAMHFGPVRLPPARLPMMCDLLPRLDMSGGRPIAAVAGREQRPAGNRIVT